MWSWAAETHVRVKIFIFHKWRRQSAFIWWLWCSGNPGNKTVLLLLTDAQGASSVVPERGPTAPGSFLRRWWKTRRKNRGEKKKNKNAPLVDIDETKANKWRLEALRLYLSLPALFYEPVYWYLPESRPFLRQMGAHPRKLLGATCRKNVQLSPLRPSTELLRPRWPPRHEGANAHKTEKITKGGKLGKQSLIPHPLFRRE